jgi:hypothetical protein
MASVPPSVCCAYCRPRVDPTPAPPQLGGAGVGSTRELLMRSRGSAVERPNVGRIPFAMNDRAPGSSGSWPRRGLTFVYFRNFTNVRPLYRRASATHDPPPQAVTPRACHSAGTCPLYACISCLSLVEWTGSCGMTTGGEKTGVGKIPDLCTAHARRYRGHDLSKTHVN